MRILRYIRKDKDKKDIMRADITMPDDEDINKRVSFLLNKIYELLKLNSKKK